MKKVNKIRVRNLGLYTFIYVGVTWKDNFSHDANIADLYFYPDNGQNSKRARLQRYEIYEAIF
jgi:hypothetical protein